MNLEGGGAMGVGPGQITDDSEMAMCILHGILRFPPPN
jgi:ADP-ribosylglycohydrolase